MDSIGNRPDTMPMKFCSPRPIARLVRCRLCRRYMAGCHGQCRYKLLVLFVLAFCAMCVTYFRMTSFVLYVKTIDGVTAVFRPRGDRPDALPTEQVTVEKINANERLWVFPQDSGSTTDSIVAELVERYHVDFHHRLSEGQSPWKLAESWVTERQILPEDAPKLGAVLKAMATSRIIHADICCPGHLGTQLKLALTLEGGQRAVFKPKWYGRDAIINSTEPYAGMDRHNGEIVAFHLARLLGLNKTPLAVGRVVNLRTEILPVASTRLLSTFLTSGDSLCFHSKCDECLNETKCVGGDNSLEGAVILWLPPARKLKDLHSPWARTYNMSRPAKWEAASSFCERVRRKKEFRADGYHLLLDAVDAAVLDFVTGNADRHDYEVTVTTHWALGVVMMDNGKSFGNPFRDERTILAPLYQCCWIRRSTWHHLLLFQHGMLGRVLESVTTFDPISPLLTSQHVRALDRRLGKIVREVDTCLAQKGQHNVFL